MPISHRYDAEAGFHRLAVTGVVTFDEFIDVLERLVDPGRYPPDSNALWDLRGLDFERVDGAFWRRIVEARRQYPERATARLAHLVTGDLAYGMLRMYQILSGLEGEELAQQVEVFRDQAAAERWLAEADERNAEAG